MSGHAYIPLIQQVKSHYTLITLNILQLYANYHEKYFF